jgi:hypothetical protein
MSFPSIPIYNTNLAVFQRQVATAINSVQAGKANVVGQITLNPSSTTTTLVDTRIRIGGFIQLQPNTLNASVASIAGIWFSNITDGSLTINHPSNAHTDQSFNYLVIG